MYGPPFFFRVIPTYQGLPSLTIISNYHTYTCQFLKVIWKRLYSTLSLTDHGTLLQLRNLINRRNVSSDPTKDVNASEDYFLLIVSCHLICAAMTNFDINSLDSFPEGIEDWILENKEERRKKLYSLTSEIISKFVDLSCFSIDHLEERNTGDHIHEYAKEIISLGVLYMEFQDGIREGDGERVLDCWRYLMLLFKVMGRKNYSVEAYNMLAQYEWLLPPRQAMQLKQSNVHGRLGCNVSCDLHMEHMNRMAVFNILVQTKLKRVLNGLVNA